MKYRVTYEIKDRKVANKILERLSEDVSVRGVTETTKALTVFDAVGDMKSFAQDIKIVAEHYEPEAADGSGA